ncbi:MAG TPA: ABC transporter permease [Bryobacteraceae bacterium]|jgi:predicted permease
MSDLVFSIRGLRRNLGFAIVAILTLALGVGLNTAMFSVVKAVLLNRLPYNQPGRLIALAEADAGEKRPETIGYTTAYDWRRLNHSFQSMSLYRDAAGAIVENGEPELMQAMRVNYDFFDTLRIPMQVGRNFVPEEDTPGNRREAIITDGLWRRRFGADAGIIGRSVKFNETPYKVVGVLPPGVRALEIPGSAGTPEVYMPLGYALGLPFACRDCQHLHLIGRLKPGVSEDQARAELTTMMAGLVHEYPASYPPKATVAFEPLHEYVVGRAKLALWLLLGAVGFVLLIGCANVANLMLARAVGRTREIALRAALGAGRARLIRQLLTESLVLSLLGGLAGLFLAAWSTSLLASLAPKEIPRVNEVRMDAVVFLFSLAVSLATGVLFGLLPALRASQVDLNDALKDLGKATAGRAQNGPRNLLVIAEIALAFVMVVGAVLLGKSFVHLVNVDPGFDAHNVLTLNTFVYGERYQKPGVELDYYGHVLARLRAIPGVESAAMTSALPFTDFDRYGFHIRDRHPKIASDVPSADTYSVSPDYFGVMKIPLRRGRLFTDADGPNAPRVALISETCAREQFPGEEAIGKQIQLGGRDDKKPWITIVGIVGDVRQYSLETKPRLAAYVAQSQDVSFGYKLVARTAVDATSIEKAVRAAFLAVDPTLPVYRVETLENYLSS